jgi:hypothetical protein
VKPLAAICVAYAEGPAEAGHYESLARSQNLRLPIAAPSASDAGVSDSKPTCGACRHGSPEIERSDFLAASVRLAILVFESATPLLAG